MYVALLSRVVVVGGLCTPQRVCGVARLAGLVDAATSVAAGSQPSSQATTDGTVGTWPAVDRVFAVRTVVRELQHQWPRFQAWTAGHALIAKQLRRLHDWLPARMRTVTEDLVVAQREVRTKGDADMAGSDGASPPSPVVSNLAQLRREHALLVELRRLLKATVSSVPSLGAGTGSAAGGSGGGSASVANKMD